MRRRFVALATALFLFLLGLPAVAGAQQDTDDVVVRSGPVIGSLDWTPCPEPLGPPDDPNTEVVPLECATLDVPIDYDDPDGATIPLALWRLPALAGAENTIGHLLLNPGGPGNPVLDMVIGVGLSGTFAEWDLIGMDPRGVGKSGELSCEATLDAAFEEELDYDSIDDFTVSPDIAEFWAECGADDGGLLPHLGTVNVAQDMDRVRAALGVEQLNYLGASYGTHLGSVFAELFPERVGRFILDGPVLAGDFQRRLVAAQIAGFEDALNRYDAACAVTDGCALQPYGARSVWRHLKWRFKSNPTTAFVEGPNGPEEVVVDFNTFMSASLFAFNVGRDIWDYFSVALLQAQQGDAALLWEIAQIPESGPFTDTVNSAVWCLDDPTRITAAEARQQAYEQILAGNESFALELGNSAYCEAFPYTDPTPTIDIAEGDTAPMLIVAGTHDPATNYDGALRFADAVRSGTLLTVIDDGHTSVTFGNRCVDEAAVAYLRSGVLPPAGAVCEPQDDVVFGFDPVGEGPNGGLVIDSLYPGYPAEGVLESGDEILSFDGNSPLAGPGDVVADVPVEIVLIRDGAELTVSVTPIAEPARYWLSDDPASATDGAAPLPDEAAATEPAQYEAGGPIAAGDYATDLLGTELTMTIGDNWIAAIGEPAAWLITKTDAEKKSPFSEAMLAVRVDAFPAAGEADVEPPQLTGAADDIDGWLAAGEFIVENRQHVMVGGRSAVVLDLRVDPAGTATLPGGCGPTDDDRCFFVAGTRSTALELFIVRTTEVYRLWLIDQGDEDPILVMAIAAEGNESFLDEATEIVASFELGAPAPQPVAEATGPPWEAGETATVPGGDQVTIPALGGLTFTLDENRLVGQDQNFVTIGANDAYEGSTAPIVVIALAQKEAGPSGDVIADAEALLALMRAVGSATPTGETIEALGQTLVGYRVTNEVGAIAQRPISTAPLDGASNNGWLPGPEAVVYVADAPEGGALAIGIEASVNGDLAVAQEILDVVLSTLSYTVDESGS